ncbi:MULTISPECIES: N-acetylmuramoyl-L-alanine amidase [Marichromatium]|uniref:N-acetylmuramoyl-L-alanine amidase AmiC n=1 Tax=Marichromatium gracile TaxID=1048 RepID=A0A4R4AAN9_MARGR|nr:MULTISPECIES: N-acetylmuramoyl-L-alanine amidase [Marichromatium]MBK1708163.1 N-acetylmuramoyl-L-alanine amidase [Marichromatium gracile]RNE89602.1 AMIN domain-containing protein [Marichromatium sp. AB31]TCW35844.1 N-acetylmuramoyl-L-alanine amidase [Marichromatium gracile]
MKRVFTLLLCSLLALPALAAQVTVEGARVGVEDGRTRVVLDTRAALTHKIFTLEGPDRVVVDLSDARLSGTLPRPRGNDPALVGLRSGIRDKTDLRIVFDLKCPVRVKSFSLPPDRRHDKHRLVIDLLPRTASAAPHATVVASRTRSPSRPEVLIAIDAGHGGADPGAIGKRGTYEKDVTLAIARKLAALVEREPGMRPLMIRDGDYYVRLRQRIEKARKHKADLFISIHADAFTNDRAHGSSVYTLSFNGASSEAARWLANRENAADLIGGVNIADSDDLLASVLIDMTQNATIEHSTEAAGAVLSHLGEIGDLHKRRVQRAGFAVLKSPDIPSMLVETAFITNAEEERRLRDPAHQERLARAILAGIKAYFRKYPPQGALLQAANGRSTPRRHVTHQGDTLSEIAQRYRVSLSSLRAENGLTDDTIRVGQVLAIPEDS